MEGNVATRTDFIYLLAFSLSNVGKNYNILDIDYQPFKYSWMSSFSVIQFESNSLCLYDVLIFSQDLQQCH